MTTNQTPIAALDPPSMLTSVLGAVITEALGDQWTSIPPDAVNALLESHAVQEVLTKLISTEDPVAQKDGAVFIVWLATRGLQSIFEDLIKGTSAPTGLGKLLRSRRRP